MVQHAGLNVSRMSIIYVTKQNICLTRELKKKNSSFGFIYLNKLTHKYHGIYNTKDTMLCKSQHYSIFA